MISLLINMGMKMYDRNPITYKLTRDICFDKERKVVRIIKLLLFTPLIPFFDYKAKKEIANIHNSNSIFSFGGGISFWLPELDLKNGEFIQNRIFLEQNYFENRELSQIKKYINTGDVILDIGANIGNHTIYFLMECKAKYVYCFEPTKHTFEILRKNIEINNLSDDVELYNFALGSIETNGHMDINKGDAGANHVILDKDGDVVVKRLDQVVFDKKIDFVKIDVEGFEYDVLIGAEDVLKKYRPIIYIEIFDSNYDKVNSVLNKMGYFMVEKFEKDYIYGYKTK